MLDRAVVSICACASSSRPASAAAVIMRGRLERQVLLSKSLLLIVSTVSSGGQPVDLVGRGRNQPRGAWRCRRRWCARWWLCSPTAVRPMNGRGAAVLLGWAVDLKRSDPAVLVAAGGRRDALLSWRYSKGHVVERFTTAITTRFLMLRAALESAARGWCRCRVPPMYAEADWALADDVASLATVAVVGSRTAALATCTRLLLLP